MSAGGKREGAGAPLIGVEHQTRRNINLGDWHCNYAESIGNNRSDGIRVALEYHYQQTKGKKRA